MKYKRLTLRKLKERIERHIEEFGDMPLELKDDWLVAKVENGQEIGIVVDNEAPNDDLKQRIMDCDDAEFEEHGYYEKVWELLEECPKGVNTHEYCNGKLKELYP